MGADHISIEEVHLFFKLLCVSFCLNFLIDVLKEIMQKLLLDPPLLFNQKRGNKMTDEENINTDLRPLDLNKMISK